MGFYETSKSEFKIIVTLWILSALLAWALINCNDNYKTQIPIESAAQIDSLNSLVMELQIEKGRYEIIIDNIRAKDSMIVIETIKHIE